MDSPYNEVMGQKFPTHISWRIDLEGVVSADALFSSGTMKKIRRGLRILEEQGYGFRIEELTKTSVDVFYEYYRQNIETKNNPRVVDLPTWWEQKKSEGIVYLLLSLTKQEQFVGGIIFRFTETKLSTAYKVFPMSIADIALPISPTMLGEYQLFSHAIAEGKQMIVHGKDRNIYGQHSAIGLAMFKTQLGAAPRVPTSPTFATIGVDWSWDGTRDVLLFLGQDVHQHCTRAVLYTTRSEEDVRQKYAALWKTSAYQITIKHENT